MPPPRAVTVSAFLAVSLDGYVARSDGRLDWLPQDADGGEDYGFRAFLDTVDVLVMGRRTYEQVLTFSEWPYPSTPVVVLSSRAVAVAPALAASVETMNASPADVIARLEARGMSHVYVDGGQTVRGFLAADLLDRLILTHVPVLIGSGIRLFGPLTHDIAFIRHTTRAYTNGLVQSEYLVSRP